VHPAGSARGRGRPRASGGLAPGLDGLGALPLAAHGSGLRHAHAQSAHVARHQRHPGRGQDHHLRKPGGGVRQDGQEGRADRRRHAAAAPAPSLRRRALARSRRVLANKARLSEALLRPKGEEFDLLPAGALPENPTDLLASGTWSELIGELKQDYEFVVIDSPVVLAVSDSLLLAADADALLLVHKPGSLERRGLIQLRDDLHRAGARALGIVFNQVDRSDRGLYPAYLESPYLRPASGKRPRPNQNAG
jgi:hypothetical protein